MGFQVNIKNPDSHLIFIMGLILPCTVTYVVWWRMGCWEVAVAFFFPPQMAPEISYDPAETAHPIKDDSLTFRLSVSACACLMMCACECVARVFYCWRVCTCEVDACLCVWPAWTLVCVYAGRAHAGFYGGASPAIDLRRISKQCSWQYSLFDHYDTPHTARDAGE